MILKALPQFALAGMDCKAVGELPAWLFFVYLEGFERLSIKQRIDAYISNVAADSNLVAAPRSALVDKWEAAIAKDVMKEPEEQAPELEFKDMSFEQRVKRWGPVM